MSLAASDIAALLVQLLPPGVEAFYDLSPGGDPYKYLLSIAEVLKPHGFDLVDLLELEVNPASATEKVADWEGALGVTQTKIALYGNALQRRSQVLSRLREHGASALDAIRSVLGPLLGYADPSQLEIVETPRAQLTGFHSYFKREAGSISIGGGGGTVVVSFDVRDDARVSAGGVRLSLIETNTLAREDLSITLEGPTGPDGQASAAWPAGSFGAGEAADLELVARNRAGAEGKTILGIWTAQLTTSSSAFTASDVALIVEGVGRDSAGLDGLGAEIYHWCALVDPALEGVASLSDRDAARAAVKRLAPAHSRGDLCFVQAFGGTGAIPDDVAAIPDACLPG